eukprot:6211149-Pleurochrysis_carterae.AAC.7
MYNSRRSEARMEHTEGARHKHAFASGETHSRDPTRLHAQSWWIRSVAALHASQIAHSRRNRAAQKRANAEGSMKAAVRTDGHDVQSGEAHGPLDE